MKKKNLDELFCEELLKKNLVDKSIVLQIKREAKIIGSIRETLLLKDIISYETYKNIAFLISKSRHSYFDTKVSNEIDKIFIRKLIERKLLKEEEIKSCQAKSLSLPFSTREILLIFEYIKFNDYKKIMKEIYSESSEIPKEDSLSESKLLIVSEETDETIMDINPLEDDEEEGVIKSFKVLEKREEEDEEETIIDGEIPIPSEEATLDVSSDFREKIDKDIKKGEREREYIEEKYQNLINNLNLRENLQGEETESVTYQDPNINYINSQKINSNIRPNIIEDKESIKEIIKEIQYEVNLQTQRITQTFTQEIGSYRTIYKILGSVIVFFSFFILSFTGWIEYQRYLDLTQLRKDKEKIIEEKNKLMEEKFKYFEENVHLKTLIEPIKKENDELKKKLQLVINELNNIRDKNKKKIDKLEENLKKLDILRYIQLSINKAYILYNIGDRGNLLKVINELKNNTKIKENSEIIINLIILFINIKKYKEAYEYMNILKEKIKNNEKWKLYLLKGILYYKKKQKKIAKKYWKKAFELNRDLNILRLKIK